MKHEISETRLEVLDSDITFEKIYEKEYIPVEYIDGIKKANFLIIPNEEFQNGKCVLFPETTRQFFEFIKESSEKDMIPDIAISDENFQQIELHSAVVEVATVIVQWIVFPATANLISTFLYDLAKKYHRKSEETFAKVKIITEETKTKKSKIITYEGPISGVKKALNQASKDLFSGD